MIRAIVMDHRQLGWAQPADCGSQPDRASKEHRNAVPVALIVTRGTRRFQEVVAGRAIPGQSRTPGSSDAGTEPAAGAATGGGLVLVNPGHRHTYWAAEETVAFMICAGRPGARA